MGLVNNSSGEIKKIKVTEVEIIVTGNVDKPYFEIKYLHIGSKEYSIGYSSYNLRNVFKWRDECFEIVKEKVLL